MKPRPGNKHQPWIYGENNERTGLRSCTVTGAVRRKHTQIREAKAEPEEKLEEGDERLETVSSPESELTETDQPMEQEPTPRSDQEPISTLRHLRYAKIQGLYRGFIMDFLL